MATYKHLNLDDRKKIATLYLELYSVKEIAEKVGVHVATIYRELKRGYNGKTNINGAKAYDPQLAENSYRETIVFRKAFKFKTVGKG